MTNANNISDRTLIWIEHNNLPFVADCIGSDPISNIAILKLKKMPEDLPFVDLGSATESPSVGTFLLSISNKLNLNPSPSFGFITDYNTVCPSLCQSWPTTYIRSNIPCEGGDGGAPVFDFMGNFVGMISVSLQDARSSFIIPARAIRRIRDDILFSGKVNYAYIGIETDTSGRYILKISPNSPADKIGLRTGDVLLKIGSFPISKIDDVINAFFFAKPGTYLPIHILRNKQEKELSVQVAARSDAFPHLNAPSK